MRFLILLTLGGGLLLSACAGPDGKVITSTPTGPGVSTKGGGAVSQVETVPSGLGPNGQSSSPSLPGAGGN